MRGTGRGRDSPFTAASGTAAVSATTTYLRLGTGTRTAARAYAVTAVELSQASSGAAMNLSFTTASPALLSAIFRYEGAAARIPVITLTVGAGAGRVPATGLTYTFRRLAVGSFAEQPVRGCLRHCDACGPPAIAAICTRRRGSHVAGQQVQPRAGLPLPRSGASYQHGARSSVLPGSRQ